MAETVACDVVVAHLHHQLGPQRLPFRGPRRAPAARTPRSIAGETRGGDEPFQTGRQLWLLMVSEARGKADMMEEAPVVVEAEQQRAHAPAPGLVAEPADDTVGGAQMLDLEHGAFPRKVGEVQALRHHPIDLDMAAGEPFFRFPQVTGERREQKAFAFSCFGKEGFDNGPAFLERKRQKRLTGLFQQAIEEDQTGGVSRDRRSMRLAAG